MLKQEINGHRLLSTTVEDLPVFHIDKLGHQEIFMGAVDLLRDFVRWALIKNVDRHVYIHVIALALQLGPWKSSVFGNAIGL
jgi:hypothetical protein